MGAWAVGNFSNDMALDWLGATIHDPVLAAINECLAGHDGSNSDRMMAAVETLVTVCEHLPVRPPDPELVIRWRESFLSSWREHSKGLEAKPGYKEARLQVIESTFDRLMDLASAANP